MSAPDGALALLGTLELLTQRRAPYQDLLAAIVADNLDRRGQVLAFADFFPVRARSPAH